MILNYIKIVQKSTSKVDIDIYCARALPRTGTPGTVTCKSVWCCLTGFIALELHLVPATIIIIIEMRGAL